MENAIDMNCAFRKPGEVAISGKFNASTNVTQNKTHLKKNRTSEHHNVMHMNTN
jgi:hypothetical protein